MNEYIKLLVESTYHLLTVKLEDYSPNLIGSGMIIKFLEKLFLITVAHVPELEENIFTYIDSGLNDSNNKRIFLQITDKSHIIKIKTPASKNKLNSFVEYLTKINDEKEFLINALKRKKYLLGLYDIVIFELPAEIQIFQEEYNFDKLQITKNSKLIINTDLSDEPNYEDFYGFAGKILLKNNKDDRLKFGLQIKYKLKFIKEADEKIKDDFGKFYRGQYYQFELPEVIKDYNDFQGTSGAPIISEKGDVVGIVAFGNINTKNLFAVPLKVIRPLLIL